MTAFVTPVVLGNLFARTDLDTPLPTSDPGGGKPWLDNGVLRVGAGGGTIPTIPGSAVAGRLAAFDGTGGLVESTRVVATDGQVALGGNDNILALSEIDTRYRLQKASSTLTLQSPGGLTYKSASTHAFLDYAGVETMRVDAVNQRVGINQSSPTSSLHVTGADRYNLFRVTSPIGCQLEFSDRSGEPTLYWQRAGGEHSCVGWTNRCWERIPPTVRGVYSFTTSLRVWRIAKSCRSDTLLSDENCPKSRRS